MVMGKSKVNKTEYQFRINNGSLEVVDFYKYLGIILSYNGSFKLALEDRIKPQELCIHLKMPLEIMVTYLLS